MSDYKGSVKIKLALDSQLNSLVKEVNDKNLSEDYEDIKVTTIDSFCENNNIGSIDVLKTDVEGLDYHVLLGAKNLIQEKKIKYIFAEVGFRHLPDKGDFTAIADYLHKSGYCFSGLYDNFRWGIGQMYLKFSNALFRRYDI